jgi:hypothetical protein
VKFDAYAGNVSGERPEDVASMLAYSLKGRVERGRPRGRYNDVFEVREGHALCGFVGQDAQLDAAFFEFKGATTPVAVDGIRRHWPARHTVSRLDACEDFNQAETYGQLVALVDRCIDPRVKSKQIAPRLGADEGTTTYWGSPSSRVMVRCYEAGKMKERLHLNKPHWVRLEAQIRPGKAVEKQLAASVSALDAWGFASWSAKVAQAVGGVDVPRFASPSTPPQFDKTTLYLARAFRRHFESLLAEFGDWECVGRELAGVWKMDDDAEAERASSGV